MPKSFKIYFPWNSYKQRLEGSMFYDILLNPFDSIQSKNLLHLRSSFLFPILFAITVKISIFFVSFQTIKLFFAQVDLAKNGIVTRYTNGHLYFVDQKLSKHLPVSNCTVNATGDDVTHVDTKYGNIRAVKVRLKTLYKTRNTLQIISWFVNEWLFHRESTLIYPSNPNGTLFSHYIIILPYPFWISTEWTWVMKRQLLDNPRYYTNFQNP